MVMEYAGGGDLL
jgi:5'-AMP-activated protein kinase catalytic alpha subunit